MNASLLQSWFVLPHAWIGALALVSFWTAALAPKGRRTHRYAGQVFLLAMFGILITALPLTIATWLRGQSVWAVFLAYLLILVGINCLNAWRAIRHRADFSSYANAGFRAGAIVLGLAGLGVVAVGIHYQAAILIAFGAIGPLVSWKNLKLAGSGPTNPQWWLRSHYGAMIGNGVATHIAFFQIGLARLFAEPNWHLIINIAWLAPLLVGAIIGLLLNRRFSRAALTQH